MVVLFTEQKKKSAIDSFMVNASFTGVSCLQNYCRLTDVNKYISSASLSTGCEHGLAGSGKHKTVKCTNPKCPFIHQN